MTPDEYCSRFREWADIQAENDEKFAEVYDQILLQIEKSCLLDRMLYAGERASRTPCPVHNGKWAGIHGPDKHAAWYEKGCRCYLHRCGCTTGWQPDEHCGCGVKP